MDSMRYSLQASLVICFHWMIMSDAKINNNMYSKSWIEDYRVRVQLGVPPRSVLTEFSLETHKIGVTQSEEENTILSDNIYDSRESRSLLRTKRNLAVYNKGERYVGEWVSDLIIVPKNPSYWLASFRVDMILLDKIGEERDNFIGLLESPTGDGYLGLSSSLRKIGMNSSISYEFSLCGNEGRKDMRSVGSVRIHSNIVDDNYTALHARVIDPYFFMVVVESVIIGEKSLATCDELNVQGAIFDNTLPGIYFPLAIYRRLVGVIEDHARIHELPIDGKIWERRKHACYNTSIQWKYIPRMKIAFFSDENQVVQLSYSGQSLVKRYYRKNYRKNTFCYIFAARKSDDERLILGRAAFEGIRLVFNRSGRAISFLQNSHCGGLVKLRKITGTSQKMSTCLPKDLRLGTSSFDDTYWIWIMLMAILLPIFACILSIPKSIKQAAYNPPIIHILVPQSP